MSLRWGHAFFKLTNDVIRPGQLNDVPDCDTWIYDSSFDGGNAFGMSLEPHMGLIAKVLV